VPPFLRTKGLDDRPADRRCLIEGLWSEAARNEQSDVRRTATVDEHSARLRFPSALMCAGKRRRATDDLAR
jgi:hypothetical protein